jgi:hypothetical protein
MQRIFVAVLATITLVAVMVVSRDAAALEQVQVVLISGDWSTNSPPLSIAVGVAEPGKGFGFVTMNDDNADGILELPLIPVGSRLALGVPQSSGEEDCDIYVLVGSGVVGSGGVGEQIVVPQLTNAAAGGSVGINYGELMAPPLALNPGDRFAVQDGVLPAWSSLRFVDESGVPDLEAFVRDLDTLPAFSGDVVVSNTELRFTFVPEPSSLMLCLMLAIGCSGRLTAVLVRRRAK